MISNTLSALSSYLEDAYTALASKQAVIPAARTVRNLSATIDTIQAQQVTVPLGIVTDIRYSIIDGVLNVKWKDPDDVYSEGALVSRFGGTKLLMKTTGYPEGPEDGTVLVNSTVKNAYNMSVFSVSLPTYQEETDYYFRFFSYTPDGTFNTELQLPGQNRFNSQSYSWDQVAEHLHDYPECAALLPRPGDVFGLNYMLSDFCYENGQKVMLNTRQLVYDHRDQISSSCVSVPWMVLGHNANVPQYVQYRRVVGNEYDDIFIQSVDDSVSSYTVYDTAGNSSLSVFEIGDGQQRPITSGCRTYSESWDLTANVHTYSDTGSTVESCSQETFAYSNQGVGRANSFLVPLSVTVGGNEYRFCGYTMTVQPVNCLNTYSAAHFNTIQFDAPENLTAYLLEKFPDSATSARYFKLDSGAYREIDWIGEGLFSNSIVQKDGCDVYRLDGNMMTLMTTKFSAGQAYFSLSSDGTTRVPYVEAALFKVRTAYSTTNAFKNYGSIKTFFNGVPNDYVSYNGKTYKCIRSVAETTATDIATQNPETLTAYFQEDTSLSVIGRTYAPGDVISSDSICGYRGTEMNSGGCNLYSESFFRQYCNNTRGSFDAGYEKQSVFDNVSTINMANGNSLLLKLFNEQGFIRHVKRTSNLTVLSPIVKGYRKKYRKIGTYFYETINDLFWSLGYYEVFGDGTPDGTATFIDAYLDAQSRIKYYMNQTGGTASAANWWLRYPNTGHAHPEHIVNVTGSAIPSNANYSYGFSPACLIA